MSTVRIRKHANNQYIKSRSGIWLREPSSTGPIVEIDPIVEESYYQDFLSNENSNRKKIKKRLDISVLRWTNVAIVSDGLNFDRYLEHTKDCDVVIAVNRTLARWTEGVPAPRYLLVNNPFVEAMGCLPKAAKKTTCIASMRTYPGFVESYPGDIVFYRPAADPALSGSIFSVGPTLSDYRNPVCAALHLSYLVNAKSITVISHDMAFTDERPGSVTVGDGLFMYPSQVRASQLIEDFASLIQKKCTVHFVGETIERSAI